MGTVLDFYNEYNDSDWVGHDIPDEITNRYEIKACLKMNDDKQVYLMTSRTNWKKYILKALASHCHESLEEEYKLSRELFHSGIVAAVEYIEGTNYNYLIRDYVEGYTVTELVEMTEEGRLQNEELRQITLKLCDILQYLHTQNPPIIHRDIKPDNIIVTKKKECKLIDFGISRRYQGKEASDTHIMGTQFSAPPEQYGFAQTNERSDIYSIGVLMFFMATGSMNIKEVDQYQIPGDILRIIKKCTRFTPKDRYASVKQLKYKVISYSYLYKKRRLLYAGITAVTMVALGLSLTTFFMKQPLPEEYLKVTSTRIDSNQLGTTQLEKLSDPISTPYPSAINETVGAQKAGGGNSEPVSQEPVKLTTSDNIESDQEGKEDREEKQVEDSSKVEASVKEANTNQISESEETTKSTEVVSEPETKEQKNTVQETGTTRTPAAIVTDESVYVFKSPLIEEVVHMQLGKSAIEAVTYKDLKQITSLLICGQQPYDRWDEHFVYGVNQHMIGSKYAEQPIYKINGEITSLEDISCMVNLERLALYNQRISDLTPLKELHYLTYLGLGSNNISELTSVSEIKSLNYLDISGNPIMNDELVTLKDLPYLWGLDLGATKVTNVYGIKDLKLSFLSLFECKMGDCVGLDEMTTLDNLIITGVNNAITNQAVDRIIKLTNLKILKIFGSDSIELSKLSALKSLYLLDLCGMWNNTNFNNMSNLSLNQLYIEFCQKLDLSGVETLPNVEQIFLRDSVCSDYTPLLKLKALKKVFCNQKQQVLMKEQLGDVPFEIVTQ